ncbi:MAG TPA: aldose epimerase [Allocoleopsis sp.]
MITIEQRQYKTYILSDIQTQSELEIVPERGGIITQWRVNNQEILYLDQERFISPELSVRGGVPILFPICGNLPDNTYTIEGKKYTLKQHGFARDLPWEVISQSEKDGISLTLGLKSNDLTKELYPFDIEVTFTYHLQGNVLKIIQNYHNQSDRVMPFSTGLHPYFGIKEKNLLRFDIPSEEFIDQKTGEKHKFKGNFDLSWDEIDVIFPELKGNTAKITDLSRNLEISLKYDQTYSKIVFWTVKGKEFYCIEPWTAARNALNTKEKLIYLQPKTSLETQVEMTAKFF